MEVIRVNAGVSRKCHKCQEYPLFMGYLGTGVWRLVDEFGNIHKCGKTVEATPNLNQSEAK
jgi:hypothetical protein